MDLINGIGLTIHVLSLLFILFKVLELQKKISSLENDIEKIFTYIRAKGEK